MPNSMGNNDTGKKTPVAKAVTKRVKVNMQSGHVTSGTAKKTPVVRKMTSQPAPIAGKNANSGIYGT